ncbi:uncharacterized protein LOC111108445 isoform X2 [Crassostrea virginica]
MPNYTHWITQFNDFTATESKEDYRFTTKSPYTLAYCSVNETRCFVWNCSCRDVGRTDSPKFKTGDVTLKCSTKIIDNEKSKSEQATLTTNGFHFHRLTNSPTSFHQIHDKHERYGILTISLAFLFGTIFGFLLTLCAIQLRKPRKRGKRFTAHTIVTNETPVNYRKINETPEEQFMCNNELRATQLYSEIADNNHCEQSQVSSGPIVSLGEYLEPINRHPTEDKPVYRSTLDRNKSNVYSHVYNHLNLETAHVMDLEANNEDKDMNHVYGISITDEKSIRYCETSAKDDPTEIKRYSTDKPKDCTILNGADERIATISTIYTDEEKLKKIESNISEFCESNEPKITFSISGQPSKESAYFVLEKK